MASTVLFRSVALGGLAVLAVAAPSALASVGVSAEFVPGVLSFSPLDPPVYIMSVAVDATGFTDDSNTDNFVRLASNNGNFSGDWYPARGTGSGTAGSMGTASPAELTSAVNSSSAWTLTLVDGVTHTTRTYTLTVSTPGIAPDYVRPIQLDTDPNTTISSTPIFTFTQAGTAISDAENTSGFAFMIGDLPGNYATSPALDAADTSWAPDTELIPDTYVVLVDKTIDTPNQSIVQATTPVPTGGAPALGSFTKFVRSISQAQSGGLLVPGAATHYQVSVNFQPGVLSFSPLDPPVYIFSIGLGATGFVDEGNPDNFVELRSSDGSFSGDLYPARGTGSGTAGSIGTASPAALSAAINAAPGWTLSLTDGVTRQVSHYSLSVTTPGIGAEYLRLITIANNPGDTISSTPTFTFSQPASPLPDAQNTSGFAFMIGDLPGNYPSGPALQASDASWAPTSTLIPDHYVFVVNKTIDAPSPALLSVSAPAPIGGASPLDGFDHTLIARSDAQVSGLVVAPGCPADLDDGTGTGAPDGGVDINDLLYFLGAYEAGSIAADLDDGSGAGTPDGGVDINDLLFFLARYEAGC